MVDGLTGMYLTLEIDLQSLWVVTGCDMDCRHVKSLITLSNTLHVVDQRRVFLGLVTVPHHYGIIVMLEGGRKSEMIWQYIICAVIM